MKLTYDKSFFNEINSEEKAYWLGFIYADGCNCKTKKGNMLSFCLSKSDEEQLKKFKSIIKSEHRIHYTSPKVKSIDGRKFISGEMCSLQIWSNKISEDLEKQGCMPRKTFLLKWPEEQQVPSQLLVHFLRGYFDGDGAIFSHRNRNSNYYSYTFQLDGTEEFVDKCNQFLFKSNTIKELRTIIKSGKLFRLRITGNLQVMKVFKFLYGDSCLFLERKFKKFKELESQTKEVYKNIIELA